MAEQETERFDHQTVDKKWQDHWVFSNRYHIETDQVQNKEYVLDMFPYPSGEGLHVGHPLGYIGSDIVARYFRAQGKRVLHPMGYDAFGLPAENYAIKVGVHPAESTQKSIDRFRQQMQKIGLSYDWQRELNSSDPNYYHWTQWLFLKLYQQGLAYRAEAPVNWCPKDQTVLANEQVKDGRCERCDSLVEQRNLAQWFFKITQYAEELLSELEKLEWPEPIKLMQKNWIGKSEGTEVLFKVQELDLTIPVFTTRIDTLFSGTFLVIAPEHQLVESLRPHVTNWQQVEEYMTTTKRKTDLERLSLDRDTTGVVLEGVSVLNPATQERMPIWLADFVLAHYGTGAVFADAHDARDFAFAKKYHILLKTSIRPADERDDESIRNLVECYTEDGILYDSGEFSGLSSVEARTAITNWLVTKGLASPVTKYKLRDWLVSRQRYWGAPIPMIHCEACGVVPVSETDLPVRLPMDVDFRPTGESPLVRSEEFHQNVTCPKCQAPARREVDTMDTFVDSAWYFLRYLNPHDDQRPFDREVVNTWLPVDWYIGGAEHAVLHLLYSRFITKALADAGELKFREPFARLKNQGLILGEDHRKMSKRWGNVINPDDVVREYGADTLRVFEMFMGPFEDGKPWSTQGLVGARRWLDRIWRLQFKLGESSSTSAEQGLSRAIISVTKMITDFQFNTAISSMMILTNIWDKEPSISRHNFQEFLQILAPFAPHIAHELWERVALPGYPDDQGWPVRDESQIQADVLILPIQINGKVRSQITVEVTASEEELWQKAFADSKIASYIKDKEIKKRVYIPRRILNIVI